ncbi:neural cell adhesion molecule L1.1-like isoform X2 [Etheostoma cragini]|uniref:neural cell adhesion molecule L1.1-like isoform X2 n=1 Tax=Etheostoma cragini TaxID=417921 RepID=UPI00155DE83A|nr:neural cell adhesion molecule L1.1-like isoform X2 [Etheostoma cragini]
MCVSQRQWTGFRAPCPPARSLLLLALSLLSSNPQLVQGAISIPKDYRVQNISQPPVLTETPVSLTAFSPEDINLPCEASGKPKPTFRWVKDGEAFGSEREESGTLRAQDDVPLSSYEGVYHCYASNNLGTAVTHSVQVIVEAQPVLPKQQKVHKRGKEGDSMMLTCNPPESSTPPNIHWMDKRMVHIKQSDRVTVGLDGNLYFSNLLKNDSRDDYICNAQYFTAGTILPDTAVRLTVQASNDVAHGRKPHLFRPQGSHTSLLALRGHSLVLECIPKGLPTPKVEWTKKDGALERTGGSVDHFGRRLHFDSISEEDDGEYECRAFNEHGSTSHRFTVSVEASPYWVKQPENLLYSPGETIRLDCQADGIPTPSITWSINGQPLTEVDYDPRRSVSGGVLILRDVEFADTAVYQCEAANKHGSVLLNTHLYVVELPPQILSSDGVVYRVIEGGDILLRCESFGSPRPHVTWEGEDNVPLLSDPRVSLQTDGTIKLSGASLGDSGAYTCSVPLTNISITAHLEVLNRTVIVASPQDVHVLRGRSTLLDCGFYKDPRLIKVQIRWRKDGQEVQESSPDDKHTIFGNGTLKVTDVQSDDGGVYSCEVITHLDHVKASGSITVVARPDPPTNLSLSDIEDHHLTLRWTPGNPHNSPVIEFVVEAREERHAVAGAARWEEWRRVPGGFHHAELTLHRFCTYRFRVIAVNVLGASDASAPSTAYDTPPGVPDSNPTGVRSESTDPKTLIITWDEMDKRFHNSHGFLYKVFWRRADGVHWNHQDVTSPPFTVNDTGTYTPFEIKVQAVNSLGEGPAPEPEIGHSGEEEPEEAPTGVTMTVTNSTVRVEWIEAQNVRGQLLGYKIYIRRLGPRGGRGRRSLGNLHQDREKEEKSERGMDRNRESWVVVVHGLKTSQEVSGLQLYSRYELSLTAFNSKGEGPPSPPHNFSTPEGAPGPPASLSFESPSDKSLILYWTPPEEINGVLLGYVVQYRQETETELQIQMFRDPSRTHMELDSLDPRSHYVFNVIARTSAGDGPPITRRGATLLDGVPPSNITIVSSNTSLNLSWVPGERERNHGFVIRFLRKTPGAQWEESEVLNSTQGSYWLTGLQPGSQYHLMVRHGNTTQWEDVTRTIGPVPSPMPGGFSTQGWLIGLISAIVLLLLILLVLCLLKRSRGGKYAVKDKEEKEVDSEARPMKDETFGEYSDDEKRSSQPSLCADSHAGSEDSLAEYGDSVDIQFNEDGSFIGQYSGRGPVAHGNESSGPASPVTTVPPPPIAPSMSSVLHRPS